MSTEMPELPLIKISVGEPDANAEYYMAKKVNSKPIFIDAYHNAHFPGIDQFRSGAKFILVGQKGTGKTAILRHLEEDSRKHYKTKFIVFRKEILEEADLAKIAVSDSASMLIDEEHIKRTRFFHHAMKRLLLSLLLAQCDEIEDPPQQNGWISNLIQNIKSSSAGEIAAHVSDSIGSALSSMKFDVSAVTKEKVALDAAKLIKRSNDEFTKFCVSQIKKRSLKCRLFLDEMHFAYRDKSTLSADAALVRDTVMAVQSINEKFIDENIDCTVYMSIRSEFLEHEEISTADISHSIQSYGQEISWESFPYGKEHPIFDLMIARLRLSLGNNFDRKAMFHRFMPGVSASKFLDYSWGKPRDIVRFFKAARDNYPNKASLQSADFASVFRTYANMAWQDIKSALTAFIPKESISVLEHTLQRIAKNSLDGGSRYTHSDILSALKPAHENMKAHGVTYEVDELFRLLYIVGIFYIAYEDAKGQTIYHRFHRGNRRPIDKGVVHIHFAVAKSLS
ncbi:P-loop ATPase, Sll1717 family [Azospirillum brasilense]|uniref:P-loop ATPase, Sll1717 family n=1 Tax=Azospirillum brasilense TaxID=192 RepID=UPI0013B3E94A|nr:ATPase [Azospirillum brasilense]